jgi:predicted HNH restriction endonuclease
MNTTKKCIECAKAKDIKQNKPECYDIKVCARKRSYYRHWEKNKRKQIKRHRYLKYRGDKCALCSNYDGLEVHHIQPQSKGGLDARFNTITLCKNCHKVISSYYSAIGWH